MNASVAARVNRNLLANNANSLGVLICQSCVFKSERKKARNTNREIDRAITSDISVCT